MKVQAEVSLYPLRQEDLSVPIGRFVKVLENYKLYIKTGTMSSVIFGDSRVVFKGLQDAFEQLGKEYDVVMTAKISNTCPEINKEEAHLV